MTKLVLNVGVSDSVILMTSVYCNVQFVLSSVCVLSTGAKLCLISDLLDDSGSVTGVDVSRHRLAACRTMLQKYALGSLCRLFVADGTTFSIIPLSNHADSKSCK